MAFNLRNRSFVKELDFTPKEWKFLLDLAAELKAGQVRRLRAAAAQPQEHRPHLREDLDPHPVRLRGGRLRPGRPGHLPRPGRLADRPQGVDGGHRPGAGPHVRRHRVPRLGADERRDARDVRRRAGVERPDRRVAPDPDALRHAHHARALRQARRGHRLRLPRRRPQQRRQLAAGRRRDDGHGRADRRSAVAVEPPRTSSPRRSAIAEETGARIRTPRTSRRASPASTSSTPTCGCRWASPRRCGPSGSTCSSPTRSTWTW